MRQLYWYAQYNNYTRIVLPSISPCLGKRKTNFVCVCADGIQRPNVWIGTQISDVKSLSHEPSVKNYQTLICSDSLNISKNNYINRTLLKKYTHIISYFLSPQLTKLRPIKFCNVFFFLRSSYFQRGIFILFISLFPQLQIRQDRVVVINHLLKFII